ncbi:hypothetical protein CMO91_02345 [Candidatus Woesearchaeota archaeon]|jgi:hypothetical protein|nr:hypothetical protein [Candidatus Woesearchaeota archaeon]|tara:strand:+ start:884 stop:1141 length:258 start_codon:yes stop_codon:yes gene_type:complete
MKHSVWHYVFLLSWTVLAIWVVLKTIGVINTPPLLEFGLPASAVVIGVFALYTDIVKQIHKIDRDLLEFKHETRKEITDLKKALA